MNTITKTSLVWLLVERGLTGTENQLAAVAEALLRIYPDISIVWKYIERGSWFAPSLAAVRPDLVIAAGNLSILPALLLKLRGIKTAYIQNPRFPWRGLFDRVYAPHHDAVRGGNVLETDGSPTRVRAFAQAGEAGTAALLIGGGRKGKQGTLDVAQLPQVQKWLVTFSRRTPDTLKQEIRAAMPQAEIYDPVQGGANPYHDFLCRAETIYVTDDSVSMISDACSTERRVHIVPYLRPSGRLKVFADHLRVIGAVDTDTPHILKDADKVASDIAATLLKR